jgi:hypothetical protein
VPYNDGFEMTFKLARGAVRYDSTESNFRVLPFFSKRSDGMAEVPRERIQIKNIREEFCRCVQRLER